MTPEQIAAMVADREAGTPGPWASEEKPGQKSAYGTKSSIGVWAQARWDAAYEENPDDIDDADAASWLCGIWGKIDNEDIANARRIARVPEMETAIIEQAAEIARLTDENTDLKSSVVSFGALWATSYANFLGLPDGHIVATHYDILEKAGGRMDSFTRTALGEAQ